jgi:hypothetical protein
MSFHCFEHSAPAVQKNLSLFHLPPTDLGVEQVQWIDYRPVSQAGDDGPIEFSVSGAGLQYIDLQNTKLYLKAKIVKADGSAIPYHLTDRDGPTTAANMNPASFVSPINLWLHSLFNQVDLSMQQQVVSSSNVYPYRSYMETLIYPYESWRGESELFYKDSAMDMDGTRPGAGKNDGLSRRCFRGLESKEIDMVGPLHLDLCQQERYVLNGVDLGIRLWPTKDAFRLMSEIGDCQVKITEATLRVCKVQVSPSVLATHNEVMKHTMTAKYPHERTEMKTFTVMAGLYSFKLDDMFQGEVPNKLVFGLV